MVYIELLAFSDLFFACTCLPPCACLFEVVDMIIHLQCTVQMLEFCEFAVPVAQEAVGRGLEPLERESTCLRVVETSHTPGGWIHTLLSTTRHW